jgi:hypothetical protein
MDDVRRLKRKKKSGAWDLATLISLILRNGKISFSGFRLGNQL